MNNIIPDMIHPLSRSWKQPSRKSILIDDTNALMEEQTAKNLLEYSTSIPSGVYDGKMWKAKRGDSWFLKWYSPSEDPKKCAINTREIIFI